MYVPPLFAEDRPEVLAALMGAHPLATLVSLGPQGLTANLIPFLHDTNGGILRAHLARANRQLDDLREMQETGRQVLVLFQGAQAYVSPSWYATKAETGKVVPTWNYLAVEIRGVPRVIDDPAWLRAQVGALTDRHEAPQQTPWSVGDAPPPFVAAQLRGIVGVEIPVAHVTGKWKASQNRSLPDRQGVIAGLAAQDNPMAGIVPGA
ncbi:FMN-binding negative transcriptional regulator [Paracoccus sp. MC1862]|uniref:FMN-binding negative transcriptional regulator n=1 Tax=Paracoccus sp. MC1862 TaxID=2760307 RepID=UPI0016004B2A|nr:FMN-binding negative transcriptional regulator [Paracoccus sp. MC1862]MBB1498171.1 FMN-binding negative transcriptional regulator [Paracoccus sp. MC1862]QQO45669.1 FMN-binding negative transcriptional regulator [Paracoccus sp. MC1862]